MRTKTALASHRRHVVAAGSLLGAAAMISVMAATPAGAAPDDGYGAPTTTGNRGGMSFPTIVAAQTFGAQGGSLDGQLMPVSLHLEIPAGGITSPTQIGFAEGPAATAEAQFRDALDGRVVVAAVSVTGRSAAPGQPVLPGGSVPAAPEIAVPGPEGLVLEVTARSQQYREAEILLSQGTQEQIHRLVNGKASLDVGPLDATLLVLMPPDAVPAVAQQSAAQPVRERDGSGPFSAIGDHPVLSSAVAAVVLAGAAGAVLWRRRLGS